MKSLLLSTMLMLQGYSDAHPFPWDDQPYALRAQHESSRRYYGSDHPKGAPETGARLRGESSHERERSGSYGRYLRDRPAPRDWHYTPRRHYEARP